MSDTPSAVPQPDAPAHESRLARALRELLVSRRTASLATVQADGTPFVSMVPYAIEPSLGALVLHVSGLAAHTGNMARQPLTACLITAAEVDGEPVHALPRLTLHTRAETLPADHPSWGPCRAAYLARFPDAEPMTALPDFRFVALHLLSARQVAGFGAARSVDADELKLALQR
jgi:putative heme iron utilization protein